MMQVTSPDYISTYWASYDSKSLSNCFCTNTFT